MVIDTAPAVTGTQLGYARVSTAHQSLDQQLDALTAAGVDATRVYTDKLSGTSTRQQRPGLTALLDYARQGDAIVVVGIDRLGRNATEVMTTIRDLGERGIVLQSIREGIDTLERLGSNGGRSPGLTRRTRTGTRSRTPCSSAGRSTGAWAVHRSAQGAGRLESCSGTADACQR